MCSRWETLASRRDNYANRCRFGGDCFGMLCGGAASRADCTAGSKSATRMPMIAKTTSNSTKVKAAERSERCSIRNRRNGKRSVAHPGTTQLQMKIIGRAVPRSTNGTFCVGRSSDFQAARRHCLLAAASGNCGWQVLEARQWLTRKRHALSLGYSGGAVPVFAPEFPVVGRKASRLSASTNALPGNVAA